MTSYVRDLLVSLLGALQALESWMELVAAQGSQTLPQHSEPSIVRGFLEYLLKGSVRYLHPRRRTPAIYSSLPICYNVR